MEKKKAVPNSALRPWGFFHGKTLGPEGFPGFQTFLFRFSPRFSHCSWLEKLVLNKLINYCYNDM